MVLPKIKSLIILLCLASIAYGQSQDVGKTFYDTRIVNGHSVETNNEGVLKMVISHRFGRVNGGFYELFGLDASTIRLGFDYGVKNWLTVGIGRSSFEKTLDGFVKAKILKQRKGEKPFPVTITALAGMSANGLRFRDPSRENYFTSRLFYNYGLLIARRFGDRFSLQLMPSMVHRNLVATAAERHDVFALGTAFRFLVTKRFTLTAEYYFTFPNQLASQYKNSLSIGMDIETKGHVFQFHVSNSRGMMEKFFISETTGDWLNGDIHIGFNISRDFKIAGRKHK